MSRLTIVADENIPSLKEYFSPYGDVIALPGRDLKAQDVAHADILLVRSVTQVDTALLSGSRVKFVGTCTIGVDHLDQEYLQKNNIEYASAPGCNAGGVLQYDLCAFAAYQPHWQNKKIGIIGCGNVGGRVYKALASLGVNCCAYDPFLNVDRGFNLVSFEEALGCDIICFHTPLTRSGAYPSYHLLNEKSLRHVKPGALILNAGRGDVIDNKALLTRLQKDNDLSVVLDVWENEPHVLLPLMQKINCATPHIAGYSYDGRLNGTSMIHEALCRFLDVDQKKWQAHCQTIRSSVLGSLESTRGHDLNEVMLSTYDIERDHRQMQETLLSCDDIKVSFDALRKEYWQRREFNHFTVDTRDNNLLEQLSSCEFNRSYEFNSEK